MKINKLLLPICLFIFICSISSAQEIKVANVFGSLKAVQNDKIIKQAKLKELMLTNPNTYASFNKYTYNSSLTWGISAVGGGLIGWPIGVSIGGGSPNWTLAGIGSALVLISIPLRVHTNKLLKESIRIYNADLVGNLQLQIKSTYAIKFNGNGVVVNF